MHCITFHSESDAEWKVAQSQLGSINLEKKKLIWPSKRGRGQRQRIIHGCIYIPGQVNSRIIRFWDWGSGGDSGGTEKSLLLRLISGATALSKIIAVSHHHGKNELTKRAGQQECRGTSKNREAEKERQGENERRMRKGEKKRGRKERGKRVRLSKQNQMQECGGSFDLCPHRLIDVAHFISLSES